MLHDRGQRHRERFGQLADGHAVVLVQPRQQGPTRGIGKRSKGAVELLIAIVNHVVKYKDALRPVKGASLLFFAALREGAKARQIPVNAR